MAKAQMTIWKPELIEKRLAKRGKTKRGKLFKFTKKQAEFFCSLLPVGWSMAVSTKKLIELMKEQSRYKRRFNRIDHNLVQYFVDGAIIIHKMRIGSCNGGRYIIETQKDKEVALEYIKKYYGGYGKVKDKHTGIMVESFEHTLKYKIINALEVTGKPSAVKKSNVEKKFKLKKDKTKKKMKKKTKKTPDIVLLKDIVIPKGTVFTEASKLTKRYDEGHYEATIGLSPDTSGSIHYFIDEDDKILDEYFTTLK